MYMCTVVVQTHKSDTDSGTVGKWSLNCIKNLRRIREINFYSDQSPVLRIRDTLPFLTPGTGMGKNQDPDPG
jgi:hypothetical protein